MNECLTFQQARDLSLAVRWKVSLCNTGEDCWCRMIEPESPILFRDGYLDEEYCVCVMGAIDKATAEHIVKLHNNYLWHTLAMDQKETYS